MSESVAGDADAPGLDWHPEEDGSQRAASAYLSLYVWAEGGSWWAQAEDAAAVRFIMNGFPDRASAQIALRFWARGWHARDDLVTVIHAVAFITQPAAQESKA